MIFNIGCSPLGRTHFPSRGRLAAALFLFEFLDGGFGAWREYEAPAHGGTLHQQLIPMLGPLPETLL
jgi:hypothetical protein